MAEEKTETIRTPLGRARGLGSAKDGTHHWIMTRLSSILLLPLSLYLLWHAEYFLPEPGDYTSLIVQIADPVMSLALILFIATGFYHACLGVQVIIEDYVHKESARIFLLVFNKLFFFALGITALYAVIYTTFALYGAAAIE